jgi:hypothetical protein
MGIQASYQILPDPKDSGVTPIRPSHEMIVFSESTVTIFQTFPQMPHKVLRKILSILPIFKSVLARIHWRSTLDVSDVGALGYVCRWVIRNEVNIINYIRPNFNNDNIMPCSLG